MKILCLIGSPRRHGNSATIAARILETAAAMGASTETIYLNDLSYRGCQACYACKSSSDSCIVNDDLASVLAKVAEAEILVLASPVYYGDLTGQLKCFIDRTFSYLVPDYPIAEKKTRLAPGKKLAFVLTQGHPDDELFSDIFPRYSFFFQWLGYADARLVRWCGLSERSDVKKRTELMALAERTAHELVAQ